MKRSLALVLALCAGSPAFAQVRVVAELALPSAPAVAPTAAITPSLSMPTLGASLSAPSLAATPMQGAFAPAPTAPVTAQAALIQTGAKLSAASKDGQTPDAVSRATFDAASTPADAPAAVAAPATVAAPARLSQSDIDGPNNPRGRVTSTVMGPVKTAVVETAEVAAMAIPFAIAAAILKVNMSNPAILIPTMLALWGLGFWAMRSHLAGVRSIVVGGWQASHDQKYRVDYNTGLQKDIRGKKYGEDRYDERADGPVGPRALSAMAAASTVAAAAFLLL